MATPREFEQCLAVELRHACPQGVINGCHLERLLLSLPRAYADMRDREQAAQSSSAAASSSAATSEGVADSDVGSWSAQQEAVAARDASGDGVDGHDAGDFPLPVNLLLVTLAWCMAGDVDERVSLLFDMFSDEGGGTKEDGKSGTSAVLPLASLVELIGWLQISEQLPSDKQTLQYEKWPIPLYRRATASEIVEKALDPEKDSTKHIAETVRDGRTTTTELRQFLRSFPICAWGECLGRTNSGMRKWQDL